MTAYITTPEQHAQIIKALSTAYPTDRSRLPNHVAALAMLKSMKPVEPCAIVGGGKTFQDLAWVDKPPQLENGTPLYAKEQQ